MAQLNESSCTSNAELQKKLENEQNLNSTGHNLRDEHDIEAGANNVTEPSPRQIHGWKVC